MQNEICVVKSFFHHVLVCEKKEVQLSTLTFGYTNAIPPVLSKHTFKVDRYVEKFWKYSQIHMNYITIRLMV